MTRLFPFTHVLCSAMTRAFVFAQILPAVHVHWSVSQPAFHWRCR